MASADLRSSKGGVETKTYRDENHMKTEINMDAMQQPPPPPGLETPEAVRGNEGVSSRTF